LSNLSPQEREKIKNMTSEERRAYFQKLRAAQAASGASAAASQP
jgi:hypothetical protein